jgi:hypothetical protein
MAGRAQTWSGTSAPRSRLRVLALTLVSKIEPPIASFGPCPHGMSRVRKTLRVKDRPLIRSSEMPGPSSSNRWPSGVNAG